MAKYVLVAFDDNIDADGFIKVLQHSPEAITTGSTTTVKVVGVFQKPTLFCECPKPSEKSVRGAKWGWWLCKNPGCGKPKRGNFQQPRNQLDPVTIRTEHKRIFLNIREPVNE